jgi:hypothetical protein
MKAEEVLAVAQDIMRQRGQLRDNEQERSMERIVRVFEALTDHKLTEVEGWTFMVVLKLCREQTGSDPDNWVDGAAYMALGAEASSRNSLERRKTS